MVEKYTVIVYVIAVPKENYWYLLAGTENTGLKGEGVPLERRI